MFQNNLKSTMRHTKVPSKTSIGEEGLKGLTHRIVFDTLGSTNIRSSARAPVSDSSKIRKPPIKRQLD